MAVPPGPRPRSRHATGERGRRDLASHSPPATLTLTLRAQIILFAAALAIRLLHIVAIRDSPYFDHPIVDAETYDQAARLIAAGRGHPDRVFWQPPGYSYFLGVIYAVAGHGAFAPRLVQAVLGSLSAVLIARLAAGAFGRAVGLAAGYGVAGYALLFYFDGELLPTTLTITLQLASLALAQKALRERDRVAWGLSGLAMGLASLVTATSLVLIPVLATFARRRALIVLGAATLAILPVTVRNLVRGGELVPISFNGGINLYIGNNPSYDATVAIRPDRAWKRLSGEPARVGVRGSAAHSDYFVARVREYLVRDPVGFLRLQLRKLRLLAGGDEVLRNHSIYPFRADSPALAALLWKSPGFAFPWGVVFPLAVVGVVACGRRVPLLTASLLAYAAVVVAFFITARYRAPLVPLMALFAAAGTRWFVREARAPQRAVAVMAALGLGSLANLGQGAMPREMNADAQYSLAVQLAHERRVPEARALYEAALHQKSDYAEAWLNLGTLHAERGQKAEAESAFARAARLDPEDADALVNLAGLRAEEGRAPEALALYREAFRLKAAHALARQNLEALAQRLAAGGSPGDTTSITIWRLLHEQQPDEPRLLGNLVAACEASGRPSAAIGAVREALERTPDNLSLRFTLGRLLVKSGDRMSGVAELRRALASGRRDVREWIDRNPDLALVRDSLR